MRQRTRRIAIGLLAGGVLLTGCGSGGVSETTSDRRPGNEARKPGGGPEAGTAAPDQNLPPGGDAAERERKDRPDGAETPTDMRSTFALDVDTASYSYAKRVLKEGTLPRPDTVRPEEFVNSFRQDYSRPRGNGFTVSMDGARTKDEDWTLLRVGLATKAETAAERKRGPASLTFVVDVSGSMGEPGRLDLVKDSMRKMVGQLRAEDSLAVISFSGKARKVLPMTRLRDQSLRTKAKNAINGLELDGSTNLGAGIEAGYQEAVRGKRAGATNRVVLLSDALANTGDTDADAILEKVGKARRDHGVTLFGVGVGSDYGDSLMEKLTNKGDGNTVYVSEPEEAERVFVHDLARNIEVRARDAKAQVVFDERAVSRFHLVGYDNRRVADEDFRNDQVDGGEVGPGHTVTAIYAVKLREGARGRVASTTVRWLDPTSRKASERTGHISAESLDRSLWKDGSPRLRTAAVATYFADALRKEGTGRTASVSSSLPGDPGLLALQREAGRAARQTEDADVRELAELIRSARQQAG